MRIIQILALVHSPQNYLLNLNYNPVKVFGFRITLASLFKPNIKVYRRAKNLWNLNEMHITHKNSLSKLLKTYIN